MGKVKLLDCTLREISASTCYLGDSFIKDYIEKIVDAGVDLVEIGFLKATAYKKGSNVFSNTEQVDSIINKISRNFNCLLMIDYGRFDVSTLPKASKTKIYGIRVCFKRHQISDVLSDVKLLVEKGYKVILQHVDIIDYTDGEIISFITKLNSCGILGYSIVDTFGSMYIDDLEKVFNLVERHLNPQISIGFHAHNNKMMANALAMRMYEIADKRDIFLDATVLGVGRGAGNANLEIMMDYLSQKSDKRYNFHSLMAAVDILQTVLNDKVSWGYRFPFFLAGVHDTHVFNINYIMTHHSIASSDINTILCSMNEKERKCYNYEYIDSLIMSNPEWKMDDSATLNVLKKIIQTKNVIAIGPGSSVRDATKLLTQKLVSGDYIAFSVNHICKCIEKPYIFVSHFTRYLQIKEHLKKENSFITSNITRDSSHSNIVCYEKLIKPGWINYDNSLILFLRLMKRLGVNKVELAGFDGFSESEENDYINPLYCTGKVASEIKILNREISEMLKDIESENMELCFLTPTLYEL